MKSYALIFVAVLLSGCASIVSGGLQSVPINSNPSGADIEITDLCTGICITKGKTPYTATLKRDSGYFQRARYKISITKNGYAAKEQTIEAGVNGWYFGNILFGGLIGMLIVDPVTGAMWSIPEDPIMVSLTQNPLSKAVLTTVPEKPPIAAPLKKQAPEIIYVP